MTREPAPEQRVLRPPQRPARELSPATAPVLAQIPTGAPGRGYWIAISFLVWLASFTLLLSLYAGWTGGVVHALEVPPLRVVLLIALVAGPLPLYYRLRRRLMAYFGAPARVVKRSGRWLVCSEQPLQRRHALLCLLGPPAMLTLLGLVGLALRWPWMAVPLSFGWAASTAEVSLALRILREPGCTGVHFRPDGVVLYGTSGAPARSAPARLWLTSLIVAAAWLLLVPFVFGGWDGWLPPLALLGISACVATAHVAGRRWQAAQEQHRRLEQEADEARQMQRSLLPAAPPPAAGVQLAALFQAAHEVSGDFYLFPSARPGVLRLVLGDVAGKGVPAALTAALAVGLLRGSAVAAVDPATLLHVTGQSLRAARRGRTMVAACAVDLDTATGCLRWCNAGLPPAALRREGGVTWLPGGGIPLGSLPQATYQGQEAHLIPGDLLLFYTDGLVEATSPLGDLFGRERLAAALGRAPAGCSAAEALACVQAEVARFIGETEPYDDITAVALRVEG
jgi:serine phosphatase RsbU (regulator of sigma subunit)